MGEHNSVLHEQCEMLENNEVVTASNGRGQRGGGGNVEGSKGLALRVPGLKGNPSESA